MDKSFRLILWILVLLVLLSSFSAGWFFLAKERLYSEYVTLEGLFKSRVAQLKNDLTGAHNTNENLKVKIEEVRKELKILESENKNLLSKKEDILAQNRDLSNELASVKRDKSSLEKKVKKLESENLVAKLLKEKTWLQVELTKAKDALSPNAKEIQRLKDELMNFSKNISRTQEEKDSIVQKLNDTNQVVGLLSKSFLNERRKNESYKSDDVELRAEAYHRPNEVQLPPIVLQRQQPVNPPATALTKNRTVSTPIERLNNGSSLKGVIVTVNKEHNFVVIDLGEDDGVGVGANFSVYRNNSLIGKVAVIQTRKSIAAADIIDIKEGCEIEIDDIVAKQ